MLRIIVLNILMLAGIHHAVKGQFTITGNVTDPTSGNTLEQVSVILYRFNSNQIITYTFSDTLGWYRLSFSTPGVFTLRATLLGYHPFTRDVVVAADSAHITLTIELYPKVTELQEVVIRSQQPIIVKQDTIIYRTDHWAQPHDQTLEDVLARIPGFKIQKDGTIMVNGKPIDRVLINGKEVSDAGTAIITRSLSPDMVKEVEVRFDEQDVALKESLIDTRKLVVLDIRLRDNVNSSLFGMMRATTGYQQKIYPGIYGNGFSFRKKTNTHVFAEHDRFGEQTISLTEIKNLGEEALVKMMEVPADFNEISEREAFHNELFGFKNYTKSFNTIGGITVFHPLSPSLKLFAGSYTHHHHLGQQRRAEQIFFDVITNNLREINDLENLSSKNKVELRFDQGRWKARSDVHFIFLSNQNVTDNNITDSSPDRNQQYYFSHRQRGINLYHNLSIEYAKLGNWSFRFKSAWARKLTKSNSTLDHNDEEYGRLFKNQASESVFFFHQYSASRMMHSLQQAEAFYKWKLGQTSWIIQFSQDDLNYRREGTDLNAAEINRQVPLFTLPVSYRRFQKWSPGIKHAYHYGSFSTSAEILFVSSRYPTRAGGTAVRNLPEYNLSAEYNPGNMNHINVSFSRKLSVFNLQKVLEGYTLRDFQRVASPGPSDIVPQPEEVFQFSAGKNFDNKNMLLDASIMFGRVRNTDRLAIRQLPPVEILFDQLESDYLALSFPLTKTFDRIPITLILEPELLDTRQQNADLNQNLYTTRTKRRLLGLKVNSEFDNKKVNIFLYPKYSHFIFQSDLTPETRNLKMVSLSGTLSWSPTSRIVFHSEARHVLFRGSANADFTNLFFSFRYKFGNSTLWIETDNLLNRQTFIQQSIFPNALINSQEAVFSRYMKAGLNIKFK